MCDFRNVYDKLQSEVLAIKGAEKKANIELLSLKEAQKRTGVIVRWVHSEAQLGNSLIKKHGGKELELFYRMQRAWRIVEDPFSEVSSQEESGRARKLRRGFKSRKYLSNSQGEQEPGGMQDVQTSLAVPA